MTLARGRRFKKRPQYHPGALHQLKPKADQGEESYDGSRKLAGQFVIATGADSGIGRAAAIAFAKEAKMLFSPISKRKRPGAREVVAIIKGCGRKLIAKPVILALPNMPGRLSNCDMRVRWPRYRGQQCGFQMTHPSIEEIPEQEFEHTFRTDVFGTFS